MVLRKTNSHFKGENIMSKNNTARALIKELANQAKQRLKNSNYGTKEENLLTKRIIARRNQIRVLNGMDCRKNDITIKIINDSVNDENFNNRVYALLDEDADMINPMSKLIDQVKFNNFSEFEQEKYILDLSAKYTKAREHYLKEHALGL